MAEAPVEATPVDEAPAAAAPTAEAPVEATPVDEAPAAAAPVAPVAKGPVAKPGEPVQPAERPEVQALRRAKDDQSEVEGRVIGWNRGGFHVVIGDITAFCPRSEMELGHPRSPKEYLDKTFGFQVLKVQKRGRRVVLSRTASIKSERSKLRAEVRDKIEDGATLQGRIASLTDFGAFIDLGGGVQGLVHVSEISHQRVERPQDILQVDQEVTVKVLSVEKGGKRISLSIRALEANPWSDIKDKYPEGTVLKGKVQKTTKHGALVELEPGLTGLLPASAMSLPRDASMARAFPPGRELTLQVVAVDDRRHRISLAPEGSALEGTRRDFQSYRKDQNEAAGQGFNALANAFKKARSQTD
jgi:ribosomal protein S1